MIDDHAVRPVEQLAGEKATSTAGSSASDGATPMTELPKATLGQVELTALVAKAMAERGMSQNQVCGQLALSPVYFSMWLRQRQARATPPAPWPV